jgi:hypothetical protein
MRVLPPCFVKGCTVRNDSDGDIQVRVIYRKDPKNVAADPDHQQTASLSVGQTHRAEEKIVSNGSYSVCLTVQAIEVTKADGEQLREEHPFAGVSSIEPDWLFVVDNNGINSGN